MQTVWIFVKCGGGGGGGEDTSSIFYFISKQVCLMSQSWDNVASMYNHLLTGYA